MSRLWSAPQPRSLSLATVALVGLLAAPLYAQGTRLLRHPDVSRDAVVFAQGGDLWIAPRTGGASRRLTVTADAAEALGRKMILTNEMGGPAQARPIAREYLLRFPTGSYAGSARALDRVP